MSRRWYILHTFSGYENKIEKTIRTFIDNGEIAADIIYDIKIPEEELTEIKEGKKRVVKRKFLPGYLLIEMDLPDTGWKAICSTIRRINGVTGFLGASGNTKPSPVSAEETKSILQKTGEIKADKNQRIVQTYSVGQQVKIIEGPFASFTGEIEEVMADKSRLRVKVTIFGRVTPVELQITQVETI